MLRISFLRDPIFGMPWNRTHVNLFQGLLWVNTGPHSVRYKDAECHMTELRHGHVMGLPLGHVRLLQR